jgi:hypothetical protein
LKDFDLNCALHSSSLISSWFAGAKRFTDELSEHIPSTVLTYVATFSSLTGDDEKLAKQIATIYTKHSGDRHSLVRRLWGTSFPDAADCLDSISQKAAMAFVIAACLTTQSNLRPTFISDRKRLLRRSLI